MPSLQNASSKWREIRMRSERLYGEPSPQL